MRGRYTHGVFDGVTFEPDDPMVEGVGPATQESATLACVRACVNVDEHAGTKGHEGSNGARGPGEGLVVVAVDWSVTDGVKLRQRGLWFSFGHLEPVPTIGHALVLPFV